MDAPERYQLAERANNTRQMVGEAAPPGSLATGDERAAVDAALLDFLPFERTRLLSLLQAVQQRSGTLSKGLLGYLGEQTGVPFADVYGVASFYALLNTGRLPVRVRLCSGVPCILAGAEQLADAIRQAGGIDWAWFPCIGQCDRAPAALVGDEPRYTLTPASIVDALNGYH